MASGVNWQSRVSKNWRGGERLKAYLDGKTKSLTNASQVRIGFLEDARYPDGTQVAMVAAVQEFGSPTNNIPSRPFFRNMIAAKKQEWGPAVENLMRNTNYDAQKTLSLTGEAVGGQLRRSIQDTNDPPLAPATIRRKGFAKTLVDTGHMLNSIDYEVE